MLSVRVRELLQAADVRDAAFVTNDDHLGSAFDGVAIFAASCGGATGSGLREDDLPDAVAVANGVADMASTPVISVSSGVRTRSRGRSTLKRTAHSSAAPTSPLSAARRRTNGARKGL